MSPLAGISTLNNSSKPTIIKDGFVHLWTARLSKWRPRLFELGSIISPEEQRRAERLVIQQRRDDFILHRGLLRSILSKYMAQRPEEIRITISDIGKPSLIYEGLEFNLSHSNDLMVCGITSGPKIGVDIQHIYPIESLERVIPKILSPAEAKILENTPNDEKMELFFTIWTVKEAFTKALGSGFQSPVNTIQVLTKKNGETIIQVQDPSQNRDWIIQEIEIESGYKSFLAVEGKEIQVRMMEFTPKTRA